MTQISGTLVFQMLYTYTLVTQMLDDRWISVDGTDDKWLVIWHTALVDVRYRWSVLADVRC